MVEVLDREGRCGLVAVGDEPGLVPGRGGVALQVHPSVVGGDPVQVVGQPPVLGAGVEYHDFQCGVLVADDRLSVVLDHAVEVGVLVGKAVTGRRELLGAHALRLDAQAAAAGVVDRQGGISGLCCDAAGRAGADGERGRGGLRGAGRGGCEDRGVDRRRGARRGRDNRGDRRGRHREQRGCGLYETSASRVCGHASPRENQTFGQGKPVPARMGEQGVSFHAAWHAQAFCQG